MVTFETILLFILIILVLSFKPLTFIELTNTIIGKTIFILLIIYFSSKSSSIGLLFTIIVVFSSEIIMKENFTDKINIEEEHKEKMPEVDKLTIEENIKSKESKTIPVNKVQNMDYVSSSFVEDKINVNGYTPTKSKLNSKIIKN